MSHEETSMAGQPENILEVRGLKKYFPLRSKGFLRRTIGYIRAVDDVSFVMKKGETLGVIGESGCGKTTLGPLRLLALRTRRRRNRGAQRRP